MAKQKDTRVRYVMSVVLLIDESLPENDADALPKRIRAALLEACIYPDWKTFGIIEEPRLK